MQSLQRPFVGGVDNIPDSVPSTDVGPSYVVPDPTDDCNTEPTTQLDIDVFSKPELTVSLNINSLDFALCSDSAKDSDGDCPVKSEDYIKVQGNFQFRSSMRVVLGNQECLYEHFILPVSEETWNFRRGKAYKVIKKLGRLLKPLRVIPQLKVRQETSVDIIYSGIATSAIETEVSVHYGLDNVSYGVSNILSRPEASFSMGNATSDAEVKADVKGDLDFSVYVIPNVELSLDAFGQLEAVWSSDLQFRERGVVQVGSPDPLVPLDVYFKGYTLGVNLTCYESLFVETGIFGIILGEVLDQDYENREFCATPTKYLFAMPLNHSNRGVGIGEYGENQYLVTEYRYLDPPLNPIDWSTAEYGIMLLNGEMISYPMRVEAPYFHSEHAQTGWNNMIIPVWTQWPVPNDVVPPNYVMDTGGGQKFWLRVETAVGRYYLYLSDWTYFN